MFTGGAVTSPCGTVPVEVVSDSQVPFDTDGGVVVTADNDCSGVPSAGDDPG